MLRKSIVFMLIGLLTFGLVHLISTQTRLFLGMERALLDGFFYLREYDIHEQNPLVSDEVVITGFDEDAIAVIGKWPWKRYVHARFLNNIEKFSPRAVMFDVVFVKPETVPAYVSRKFDPEPDLRHRVEEVFSEMDGQFSAALRKYNNVYLDLQLVERPRPELPEFYQNRIRFNETVLEAYAQPTEDNESPIIFHSLEPVLNDFVQYAHPVVINVLSDDDGVTRSFPLYYTYRRGDRTDRNLFSVTLALAQRYYRVAKGDISITPSEVVIRSARAPVLNMKTRQPAVSLTALDKIAGRIQNPDPPNGYGYNQNLYNFLVNQLLIGVETEERIPLFPLHLLPKGDNDLEILDGWEVLDAARRAGSKKIQTVFYRVTDIHIETPVTGFYAINFAGSEKRYVPDPETGVPVGITPIATRSYKDVFSMGELPDLPELDRAGAIRPGYDREGLEAWYYGYCEEKAFAIYRRAQQALGENALNDASLQEYMGRYPEEGKYFFYYNFFVNRGAAPGMLKDLASEYADFGRELGQAPAYFFSEKEMVRSLMDVYRKKFTRYYHKFVFAGATAVGLGDIQQTPYGTMTGIHTIVNAFNTLVTQNFLRMSSDIPGLNLLLLLGLSILCGFAYGLTSVRISGLVFVILLAGTLITGFLLFNGYNVYLRTIPLLIANAVIFVSIVIFKVLTEQKDKRFLKSTFSSYLAPEIIDEMYVSKTMPTLGGEARAITAYFTDIESFSTFSEKLTAHQLVELINAYLTAMTDMLIDEGGTLDKYEGDAIIAFFGAPMALPDHPLRACRVALGMQSRLHELRRKWAAEPQGEGEPDPNTKGVPPEEWRPGDKWPRIVHEMRMRIGINTGEIVVGNMGSAMRMNYTMMGDAVNLAARLEAAGKQYGVYILVSEDVLNQEIPEEGGGTSTVRDHVAARFIDRITVVGKCEPVRVFELFGIKGELAETDARLIEVFEEGIACYLQMEWDAAIAKFKASLPLERPLGAKTTPSEVYIQRCRAFKESPPETGPGATWDGVYRLMTK